MVSLGLESGAAVWYAHTNPLSYGSTPLFLLPNSQPPPAPPQFVRLVCAHLAASFSASLSTFDLQSSESSPTQNEHLNRNQKRREKYQKARLFLQKSWMRCCARLLDYGGAVSECCVVRKTCQ